MVHTYGAGPRCPKCGSTHVDSDTTGTNSMRYCLECGWVDD